MSIEKNEPRIMVIRRRYIGDLILLEPFLRNLREAYPRAWISLVVDEGYGDVLRGCSSLDAIVELPVGGGLVRQVRGWRAILRGGALKRVDLAFDFARNERAAVMLALARARRRVSHEISDDAAVTRRRWSDRVRRKLMTTDLVRLERAEQVRLHTVDFNNLLVQRVGIDAPHRVPVLPVDDEDRARARSILRGSGVSLDSRRGVVLLHLGGRGLAKQWPPERFARVADALEGQLGCETVVSAGPGELDLLRRFDQARARLGGAVLDQPIDLRLFYAVLAECALFVGNDSGPAHMAAAVGTPSCVLFGASRTTMWRSLGDLDEVLQPSLPCGDSCVRPESCAPGSDRFCVRRISVDEVVTRVRELFARAGVPNRFGSRQPAKADVDSLASP